MGAKILQRSLLEPVGRLWRPAGFAILLGSLVAPMPAHAVAASTAAGQASAFSNQPQWISSEGERPAQHLIALLQNSDLDGLDPNQFNIGALKQAAIAAETEGFAAADKANAMFDAALVAYVRALRSAPARDWIINDREAAPAAESADELLSEAA